MPLKFRKVLVANRGEIALRVMRTARKIGLETVAVYSEADRNAPHVLFADEAVCIGPAPSSASYLLGDKIIETALKLHADCIHPGYGFLSENAGFVQQVEKAGLTFIGPSAKAMEVMGSKLEAKAAVKGSGIPMVPGTDAPVHSLSEVIHIAQTIGFPLLIKASAGGGGKGMRIVDTPENLEAQIERAMSEAQAAFGDSSVFLEKYIHSPKHIEIQVFGDQQGNYLHLFERECSIQRRHQKLIEEAPSAVVSGELRTKMGQDAINVAKACNYTGAGTVEFLLDREGNYYFLEMNTRLQVEHPVTECITGLDLVAWQFLVANGDPLPLKQEQLTLQGHAIELRICAEDPDNSFLPSVGKLEVYRPPHGEGIRVDDGYVEGMEVPMHYDPLLGKLIVHGKDRPGAIAKMLAAIADFHIEGVKTTLPFGKFAFHHPRFIDGTFDTHFVENHFYPVHDQEKEVLGLQAALLASRLQLDYESELKIPKT